MTPAETKRLNLFERDLTIGVSVRMVAGLFLGKAFPGFVGVLVEVPVMLTVYASSSRTRHWFPET